MLFNFGETVYTLQLGNETPEQEHRWSHSWLHKSHLQDSMESLCAMTILFKAFPRLKAKWKVEFSPHMLNMLSRFLKCNKGMDIPFSVPSGSEDPHLQLRNLHFFRVWSLLSCVGLWGSAKGTHSTLFAGTGFLAHCKVWNWCSRLNETWLIIWGSAVLSEHRTCHRVGYSPSAFLSTWRCFFADVCISAPL